jgi:hypothetical protein
VSNTSGIKSLWVVGKELFKKPPYIASPAAANPEDLLRQTTPILFSRLSTGDAKVALYSLGRLDSNDALDG